MNPESRLTRREFASLAGAGLFVFFPDPAGAWQEPSRTAARPGYPSDFNAYLRIGPEGRVTCFVGKVELGQGSQTALAQLLAEELEVGLDAVDMTMSDTDVCPWDAGTFGSQSIRIFGPVLKAAAAEARAVLVEMASERLGSPRERLRAQSGAVADPVSGKRVSYGELVAGRRIERHIEKAPLEPVKLYSVVGQSPRRKDAFEKVTGRAKYAGDFRMPGLLHARLVRPPAHGVALREVDTSAAEKIAGIRVVRDGDIVAVLHEHRDVADRALGLVKARFDRPQPGTNDQTIFAHILKTAPAGQVLGESGNLAEGERLSKHVVEQTYLNSYVAHSALETHSATAVAGDGKVTVWASTQTPFPLRQQVSQALGVAAGDVRVVAPYVGGGFGGKSASRQAIEAARLAKITGRPVQVVWDRSEEFFFDTFRPAAVVKIRAGLTAGGKIGLWDFHVFCAGDREARQFYDVPHQRTVSSGNWGGQQGLHPFATGPWRAPAVNTSTFARESHIDTLAGKAGMDPLAFRLNNLVDARMRRVLEAAATRFGWKPGRAPSGRGVGVACAIYLGTYVATMAEVSLDKTTGKVRVKRVVCAQDQGVTVSPDGSRQQIEGAITMGLGYALTEEVRFRDGQVFARNFDNYEIPRFSWLPEIGVVLVENPETAASGCGEPPIVTMGAVIANAIHDAAGIRLLQLPMTPARVLDALKRI